MNESIFNSRFNQALTVDAEQNKKLSYPQRKCASNVAILYDADGISI